MSTKSERQAEQMAAQRRLDAVQAEADRQTHLVDPLTHPSSGDPPPAISEAGDRLGAVPLTRNAVADMRQAEQEGLDAAEKNQPTKAERAASKPRPSSGKRSGRRSGDSKRAALAGKSADQNKSTADASKAKLTASSTEKIAAKRDEAAEKTQTPSLNRSPSGTRPAAEPADKR